MKFRLLLLPGLLACCAAIAPAQTGAPTTNVAPATPAAPANPYPNAIATADIIVKSEALLAQIPAPSSTPGDDPVVVDIKQKIASVGPELQVFADQTAHVLATSPTLDRIRTLQNLGKYFSGYPKTWQKAITDRLTALGVQLKQIDDDQKIWSDTGAALAKTVPPPPPTLGQRVAEVMTRLAAARKQFQNCQNSLLSLQAQVTQEHALTSGSMDRLGDARLRAITQLFQRNAPPLWSNESSAAPADANAATWSKQVQTLENYVRAEPGKFAIHAGLLALLTLFFYWLRGYARQWTAEEPGIRLASGIFETPVATAGLLSLLASPLLYYPIAPRLLSALLGALALVPSVILLRRLIEPRLFPILYALVTFFFLEEFRSVAALSPGCARAFFLAEILGGIVFLLWLLLSLHGSASSSSSVSAARSGWPRWRRWPSWRWAGSPTSAVTCCWGICWAKPCSAAPRLRSSSTRASGSSTPSCSS
jgi:hypothetical protein